MRHCSNCGAEVVLPQTSSGIRHLLPSEMWPQIRDVRNGLTHGYRNIQSLSSEVKYLNPVLQKALLKGILDLINMPLREQDDLIREPLQHGQRSCAKVCARIHNLAAEDVLSGRVNPRFEITSHDATNWVDETGKKRERGNITLKLVGHEGTCSPQWIEILAQKDPEDAFSEIKVQTDSSRTVNGEGITENRQ